MTLQLLILFAAVTALAPVGNQTGHDGWLNVQCTDCHTRLPLNGFTSPLRNDTGETCLSCHQQYHGKDEMRSHPENAIPSMRVPPDMPLDATGRITCVTCHVYHGECRDEYGNKVFYLRRSPGKVFCYSCHEKL